jgi:hypothetical protein
MDAMRLHLYLPLDMARVVIHHPVGDHEAWRRHFDADKTSRAAAGITDVAVLRDADDPDSVRVVHEGDAALVEPMLQDPELAKKTQAAGVIGTPEVRAI